MNWWVKPLAALLALGALWWGIDAVLAHQRSLGAAAQRAAYAKGYATAAATVAADEARKLEATEKAHAEDVARASARHAADLAARSRLERLLASSAAAGRTAEGTPGPTGPGPDDATGVFRSLFESCAIEYGSLGKEAGELADQVIGLQNFLQANEIGGAHGDVRSETATPVGERPRAGSRFLATQPTTAPSLSISTEAAPPT